MKIVDLSHTITQTMPMFPGEKPPVIRRKMTHHSDGAQVIEIKLTTHTGTHLDCPLHFIDGGNTTEMIAVDKFYGQGFLMDCSNFGTGESISLTHVQRHEEEIRKSDFVLVYTGWSEYWGTEKYFDHFPVLADDAAKFLVSKKLKGIGLDVISIDAIDSTKYPNHIAVLGNEVIIIENLTNLHLLKNKTFHFAAFPLKIADGDGSPVRPVALVE